MSDVNQIDQIIDQLQSVPCNRSWRFPVVDFSPLEWFEANERPEPTGAICRYIEAFPQKFMCEEMVVDAWILRGFRCGEEIREFADIEPSMPAEVGVVGRRLKYNPDWVAEGAH